ncbi:MAG: GNAT family N-acetyltransferase [Thermobispora sp.]|nr:GNAT family N-acetyltransferase [Thermobispora sp.]
MSEVVRNEQARRYEIFVEGERAGLLTYRLSPGCIEFPHTKVDERFEGRGLGSRLVRAALDDARAAGLKVAPTCPFVAAYIRRHPEYRDLVADDCADLVR